MTINVPNSLFNCGDKPNCVSSLAGDSAHYIEPFRYSCQHQFALVVAKKTLLQLPRAVVVKQGESYLKAEIKSLLFHYVDDVDCILAPEENLLHVRSASRAGYYDFGVNRRRVERMRVIFNQMIAKINRT